MGQDNTVSSFDPNPPVLQDLQQQQADFLQGIFSGDNPFANMASPLQQQATGAISQFLGQPAPEQQVFDQLSGDLAGLAQGGGVGAAQQVIGAAQPIFQQNLDFAQGQLQNAAPGRFSSAFVNQGIDLGSRALQDFNLFQQQALQQGQQTGLQAAGLLGNLASQAGQQPFQRMLGAGQLGAQISQQQISPLLSIMQGGLQFGHPAARQPIVGEGGGVIEGDAGDVLTGALGGAGTGAAIGSIVPGLGTAVGAIGGGLLGGLGSLF